MSAFLYVCVYVCMSACMYVCLYIASLVKIYNNSERMPKRFNIKQTTASYKRRSRIGERSIIILEVGG